MLRPVTGLLSPPEPASPVQRPPVSLVQARTDAPVAITPEPSPATPSVRENAPFDPAQLSFGGDEEVIRTASPRLEVLDRATGSYRPAIVSAAEATATGEQFLERDRQARAQADPASLPAQGPADVGLEHDVPAFTERLQDQLYNVTEAYSADPSQANRGRLRDASVAYNTWARFLSDHPQMETPSVTEARMRLEPILLERVSAVRENRPLPPLPGVSPTPIPEESLSSDWDTGASVALQDRERVATTADGDTTVQRETTYGIGLSAARERTSVGVGVRYSSTSTDEDNNRPRWEGDVRFSRPGVDITVGYRDGSGLSLSSPGWVIPLPRTDGRFGIQPSVFSNPTDEQPLDATFRGIAGERTDFSPFRGTGLRLDLVKRF